MRVEPFTTGSYVHVLKRGARGMDITHNDADRWRFLRALFFMNDEYSDKHWMLQSKKKELFTRPESWPERKPLTTILCYTLLPNHFHLLLQERKRGGVSLFIKKLSQSMSEHANKKYNEKGSIFQGAYRSKTIDSDVYLQRVAMYIMVKNTFELHPKGGLHWAEKNFEKAWPWAISYPFSSLGDYAGTRTTSPIITKEILENIFPNPKTLKTLARDMIVKETWEQEGLE